MRIRIFQDIGVLFFVLVLSFGALYPTIMALDLQPVLSDHPSLDKQNWALRTIEYDSASTMRKIRNCLKEEGSVYQPSRNPGQPIYIMFSAWFLFLTKQVIPSVDFLDFMKYFSLFVSLISLILFHSKIKRFIEQPIIQLFVLLSFSLHPIFILLSLSVSEEAFTLFLCILAWKLMEYKNWRNWSLVLFAMAVGSKPQAVGFLPLIFSEYIDKESIKNLKSLMRNMLGDLFIILWLTFLFYLPALASQGMNPQKLLYTTFADTDFDQRLDIGWFNLRTTLLWWLPIGLYLVLEYGKNIVKEKRFYWIHKIDVLIFLMIFFCFVPSLWGAYVFAIAVSIVGFSYFREHFNRQQDLVLRLKTFFAILSLWLSCLSVLLFPFSRSYTYFILIPLLYLMVMRFKKIAFWAAIVFFSYASMFHYFQVTAKKILIHKDGYYWAFQTHASRYYNDFGFVFSPKEDVYEYYFPWVRNKN